MSDAITTGSYLANVAMIGGILIDQQSKKFESLRGGGADGTSVDTLRSTFTGSTSGSVIAALNYLKDTSICQMITPSLAN